MCVEPGMPGRRRRWHCEEFEAWVVVKCRRFGVSIESVALANRPNANLSRKPVAENPNAGAMPPALKVPPSPVAYSHRISEAMRHKPIVSSSEIAPAAQSLVCLRASRSPNTSVDAASPRRFVR